MVTLLTLIILFVFLTVGRGARICATGLDQTGLNRDWGRAGAARENFNSLIFS